MSTVPDPSVSSASLVKSRKSSDGFDQPPLQLGFIEQKAESEHRMALLPPEVAAVERKEIGTQPVPVKRRRKRSSNQSSALVARGSGSGKKSDPSEPDKRWRAAWEGIVKKDLAYNLKKWRTDRANSDYQVRRISGLVIKEVRKRVTRHMRTIKDQPLRSKKLTREMQTYWRRAEKEKTDTRKKKGKEEADRRKREQEVREVERQQKKLEFLLKQTELYSHFIGKNMGITDQDDEKNTLLDVDKPLDPTQPGAVVVQSVSAREEGIRAARSAVNSQDFQDEVQLATQKIIDEKKKRQEQFDMETKQLQQKAAGYSAIAEAKLKPINKGVAYRAVETVEGGKQLEMDLLNPSTMPQDEFLHKEPYTFNGKLKSYQLKGLNWLVNLFDQGINGILADEMGLGKTIQTISFLAHLCAKEGIWGPFLVVAPSSTLHQWQQELTKFAPELKSIPYWGSQAERKIIRKFWTHKDLYTAQSPFHVVITSYNVVVTDEKFFHKLKWQYLILDEAQAIKNAASQRWKSLLNLKCRNRLLLTGTPIQNSMAELWALLHFIMPDFFDSHNEFNEWFSKDIEGRAAGAENQLNAHQLTRLHMILQPFMLRRVKKDVEHEMAPKIEIQVNCHLAKRQRILYQSLQNKVYNRRDELMNSQESLMNLVMQFRKVCNHPEIFERRGTHSPYFFQDFNAPSNTPTLVARTRTQANPVRDTPHSVKFHLLLHPSSSHPLFIFVI